MCVVSLVEQAFFVDPAHVQEDNVRASSEEDT